MEDNEIIKVPIQNQKSVLRSKKNSDKFNVPLSVALSTGITHKPYSSVVTLKRQHLCLVCPDILPRLLILGMEFIAFTEGKVLQLDTYI